jgi:glutaredoxin-related protein
MPPPRINSRTPLQTSTTMVSPPWPPTTMSVTPLSAYLMAAFHPRKTKHRTTFAALLILVCLTTYIFVAHTSYLSPPIALRHSDSPAADQLAVVLETIQNSRLSQGTTTMTSKNRFSKGHRHPATPPLRLDPPQELAAVTSFLASLPQNVIPPTVDPSRPIDPQLVLDFDTRGYRAREEVRAMVDDVWARNPVLLYSKVYSPASRELKGILGGLNLKPAPTIIDVDVRDDAAILVPMLKRLLPFPKLPILLIGGIAVGSIEEVRQLEKNGELQKSITASGSTINGAKRKKHKK